VGHYFLSNPRILKPRLCSIPVMSLSNLKIVPLKDSW